MKRLRMVVLGAFLATSVLAAFSVTPKAAVATHCYKCINNVCTGGQPPGQTTAPQCKYFFTVCTLIGAPCID
jgi:hypothetical protein